MYVRAPTCMHVACVRACAEKFRREPDVLTVALRKQIIAPHTTGRQGTAYHCHRHPSTAAGMEGYNGNGNYFTYGLEDRINQ